MRKLLRAFKQSGFVKGLVYSTIGTLSFPALAIIKTSVLLDLKFDFIGLSLRCGTH